MIPWYQICLSLLWVSSSAPVKFGVLPYLVETCWNPEIRSLCWQRVASAGLPVSIGVHCPERDRACYWPRIGWKIDRKLRSEHVRTLRNINPQGLGRSGRHRCHFGFCWRCLGGRHCHCRCGRLCDGWCHGCPHRAQHRSWGPWWDIDDWNLHRRQKGQKETGSNFDALDIFGSEQRCEPNISWSS